MKKLVLSAIAATGMLTALVLPAVVITPQAALAHSVDVDFNGDDNVDIADFFLLQNALFSTKGDDNYDGQFDLNDSGGIDAGDLFLFLINKPMA